MKFGRNKTRRRVILKIVFVWLLSIAMSLPLSLMYSKVGVATFPSSTGVRARARAIDHVVVGFSRRRARYRRFRVRIFTFVSYEFDLERLLDFVLRGVMRSFRLIFLSAFVFLLSSSRATRSTLDTGRSRFLFRCPPALSLRISFAHVLTGIIYRHRALVVRNRRVYSSRGGGLSFD